MTKKSKGLFREPAGCDEPVAYVVSDGTATFMTETEYRADAVEPAFDSLPTRDKYEEEIEKEDIEAIEDAEIEKHRAG